MIKRQRYVPTGLACVLAAFALLVAPLAAAQPARSSRLVPGEDRVAVRVNGAAIRETAVEDRLEQLYPTSAGHGGLRPEKLKELRAKAIHQLLIEELAWQSAVRTGQVGPILAARAEQRRWRAKYGPTEFDAALRERGITPAQYVRNLQKQMTVERMVRTNVEIPARISEAELHRNYEQNKAKFYRPERVRLQLFLVALEPNAKPEAEREAKRKIDDVYQQLRSGKDFSELAYQSSEDMYRAQGGEVGWMHKGSLDPEFESLAFSLPIGAFSTPLRTPAGYNILKVEDREGARQLDYQEVRGRLKAELEDKRTKELREKWEARLRKGARIEFVGTEKADDAASLVSTPEAHEGNDQRQ